jgi:cell division septation protein DedD
VLSGAAVVLGISWIPTAISEGHLTQDAQNLVIASENKHAENGSNQALEKLEQEESEKSFLSQALEKPEQKESEKSLLSEALGKLEQEESEKSLFSAEVSPEEENTTVEDQSDISSPFSIQVAAFKDKENAEEFCSELLSKRYPARMEYRTSAAEEEWHYVLIGTFRNEQDAIPLAEQFREQEGMPYMIVHQALEKLEQKESEKSFLSRRASERSEILSLATPNK